MTKDKAIAKLTELKGLNLPKMAIVDIAQTLEARKVTLGDNQIEVVEKYLSKFVNLDNPHKCLFCGSSSYEWGLEHGTAHCRACSWEYRLYHYIEDDQGNSLVGGRLDIVLQYHPDCYVVESE
jgi:hypothetical protein